MPEDVVVVEVFDPNLLQTQFGVTSDNQLWTVRYLKRSKQRQPESTNYFRWSTESKSFVKVE